MNMFSRRLSFLSGIFITAFILFTSCNAFAQCPVNIDFETGTFANWQCYKGFTNVLNSQNNIVVTASAPTANIHTIIPKSTAVDPYGLFPVSAPDGSGFSVRLGNNGVGAQAERLTYTFVVPTNESNFTLTYQYAVVLQDGGHAASSQPRFTAKVFDVAANSYISCSSFDYVATSGLPGFTRSAVSSAVYYKNWTPVTVSLSGYQGKQVRLEFTTADCTESGHFGYAYVDINKTCTNLVDGIYFCPTAPSLTINGPPSFDKYIWYNADRSQQLGTSRSLVISPPPADGTGYVLDVVPFAGFGCQATISTVVHAQYLGITTTDPLPTCGNLVDITQSQYVTKVDASATITYWKDAAATVRLPNPTQISQTGTYYVKATSPTGCVDIKPLKVITDYVPNLTITNPAPLCPAFPTDITASAVTAGSEIGLSFTYWQDAAATRPLTNPTAVTVAGTYYIKGLTVSGCSIIKPVSVTYIPPLNLTVNQPAVVCFPTIVDITDPAVTAGSQAGVTLTYWRDAQATLALTNPSQITASGIFYIKASYGTNCSVIKPVTVVVNPMPAIKVTDPPTVCDLSVVDITASSVTVGSTPNIIYTYWQDAQATVALTAPDKITAPGVFYIKGTNTAGCFDIKPVNVTFFALPALKVTSPAPVCFPATVDIAAMTVTAGSNANLNLSYWQDADATIPVSNPNAVSLSGTYFIKAINANGCQVVKPVVVTVNPLPKLVVTNPPDVCFPDKVDLTAAAVTDGSTGVSKLSYWKDDAATIPLSDYAAVADSGRYTIKATNIYGCEVTGSVLVTVHKQPVIKISTPRLVFQPNTIDLTNPVIVTHSSPDLIYTYYTDASLTTEVERPTAVSVGGTYYIKGQNAYGCYTVKPVELNIPLKPDIVVPKAFTPLQASNNRLYPFLVGIKTFLSFMVYNRWGNLVFQTNSASPDKGWDGSYKGATSFMDTYTWSADGYDINGLLVHRSGSTMILK